MTTLSDLLYVAWFALIGPLIDYSVFWPRFHRRLKVDPAGTRTRLWAWSIGSGWLALRDGAVEGDVVEVEKSAVQQESA